MIVWQVAAFITHFAALKLFSHAPIDQQLLL